MINTLTEVTFLSFVVTIICCTHKDSKLSMTCLFTKQLAMISSNHEFIEEFIRFPGEYVNCVLREYI